MAARDRPGSAGPFHRQWSGHHRSRDAGGDHDSPGEGQRGPLSRRHPRHRGDGQQRRRAPARAAARQPAAAPGSGNLRLHQGLGTGRGRLCHGAALHHDGKLATDGTVGRGGVRLADARWNLAFDQVRGPVRYSAHGFRADQLDVRMDGLPGKLSMRSGDDAVRDRRNVLEAELDATFGAEALLDHAPELAWLSPYLRGKSPWTVGVVVPAAGAGDGRAAHLTLRSTLVGTALSLPAPLDKPAHRALATTVDVPLPMGTGEVAVAMGEVIALRARKSGSRTGIRVSLGSGAPTEAPP